MDHKPLWFDVPNDDGGGGARGSCRLVVDLPGPAAVPFLPLLPPSPFAVPSSPSLDPFPPLFSNRSSVGVCTLFLSLSALALAIRSSSAARARSAAAACCSARTRLMSGLWKLRVVSAFERLVNC